MNRILRLATLVLAASVVLLVYACPRSPEPDLIGDTFPEGQAELRAAVDAIAHDAMTANINKLQDAHLDSAKFTKFGPRSFERQDVASANASEAAFFGSISNLEYEARDLKIDVFGDVGIATYYPHVSFIQDGEVKTVDGRQTLVFLNTSDGWKIVHEHGTIRK